MALFEVRKFVAPEFLFGVGARFRVGDCVRNLDGRNVMVVSDPGVIAAGWLGEVVDLLDREGIQTTLFSDVTPNPKDQEIQAGVEIFQQHHCDMLIAVGGGSVIDCAKAIGIVAANGGDILDYQGVDAIPLPGPPLICIPTTAGSSADISQFAIIADTKTRNKVAIISKSVVPDIALIDPATTVTVPPYLTACTGLDAFTHAVEAYVSTANSPIVDGHALSAMRAVHQTLLATIASPADLALREKMSLASLEAGLAFSNASLGATHAMAHSLGGYLDLPHGETNALLLEHVTEFNFTARPERFLDVATTMGLDLAGLPPRRQREELIAALRDFRERAGVHGGLGGRGIDLGVIGELATHAVHDACIFTNPRRTTLSDVKAIYAQAI